MHWHMPVQFNFGFLAGLENTVKERLGVFLLFCQQRIGEFERLRQAYTPVRERPHLTCEQAFLWCIMQIDVVLVGEHELHQTQRIAFAGGWRIANGKFRAVN